MSLIQQATQSLQNQINQPQQPSHQQQLSNHLTKLYNSLDASPVDGFSPAWRDALEELGVADQFGSRLQESVRDIFEKNQITPQTALQELQEIQKDLSNTESNLSGLVNGLEYFDVGEDVLTRNKCEVGVIVPRAYVDDNLRKFGSELIELEKLLLVFSELATGHREPTSIRQISSSELSVFLDYIPEIGACIAIAVERIVALYKQLLEIKKLKQDLITQHVPEEKLSGIDEYASSIVSPKLDELANELMEKYGDHLDPARKNEVSIEVRHSLSKLANRIDRGFSIELRVAPPDKNKNNNEVQNENEGRSAAIQQIMKSAANIQHLGQNGEPVLFLPENDPPQDKQI